MIGIPAICWPPPLGRASIQAWLSTSRYPHRLLHCPYPGMTQHLQVYTQAGTRPVSRHGLAPPGIHTGWYTACIQAWLSISRYTHRLVHGPYSGMTQHLQVYTQAGTLPVSGHDSASPGIHTGWYTARIQAWLSTSRYPHRLLHCLYPGMTQHLQVPTQAGTLPVSRHDSAPPAVLVFINISLTFVILYSVHGLFSFTFKNSFPSCILFKKQKLFSNFLRIHKIKVFARLNVVPDNVKLDSAMSQAMLSLTPKCRTNFRDK